MPAIQRHRLITVTTPLGADALLFHRMTGKETLSRLYKYRVDFLSENNNIVFDDILGQNICVNLRLANNRTRHFNGFVSRFSQRGTRGEYNCYRAIVRPWLWFLTRMYIPAQFGHPFQCKPATYSNPNRPLIPTQIGHP